ncbi:uncharacterized protein LOC134530532 isoform X2 [Bacillus rossius redtenbacheri]|uniref:uncharacterized protein LOC134530532 isoform X2 n=1 Tax=Bacillus rossius redtenbacheri TaxID=93214 RepID=UPI002FDE47A2
MADARRCLLLMASLLCRAAAQVVWTPIYLDGSSQVDLWTQASSGCGCGSRGSGGDCACCVPEGGCPCGPAAPHRCAQCGLEQHCADMCNVTIDSRRLAAASGRTFGQIKSPAAPGPATCRYLLRPAAGQRVELQVYRLVGAGRLQGDSCRSGSLRLEGGAETSQAVAPPVELCGANERFDPPVVLFADEEEATLVFRVEETTARSQFLAYFSFTPRDGGQGTRFHPRGGRRVEGTDCDWLYEDPRCLEAGACVLASAGYPGLYPPSRRCRYLVTAPPGAAVSLAFTALSLPHSRCSTDFVAVYESATTAGPLLASLCANRKASFTHPGPQLLIEFSSGAAIPPYSYNGFLASLQFQPTGGSTEPSATSAAGTLTSESGVMMDGMIAAFPATGRPDCELVVWGNSSRSGHLDSRALLSTTACTLRFIGRTQDSAHVALLAFRLSPAACTSAIQVFDGLAAAGDAPMTVICSPDTKRAQDGASRHMQREKYTSSHNAVTVVFKLSQELNSSSEGDFVEVAYSFHDEQGASCGQDHRGSAGPLRGQVAIDPAGDVLESRRCQHRFLPAPGQSLVLSVTWLGGRGPESTCHTQCGDGGCRCVAGPQGLSREDHVAVSAEGGPVVTCLCGDFQQEWLPVSVRSWSSVRLEYHAAAETSRFALRAEYSFQDDASCGRHRLLDASGVIRSSGSAAPASLNHFQHLDCSWLLGSPSERQVTVEVSTNQSRAVESGWSQGRARRGTSRCRPATPRPAGGRRSSSVRATGTRGSICRRGPAPCCSGCAR